MTDAVTGLEGALNTIRTALAKLSAPTKTTFSTFLVSLCKNDLIPEADALIQSTDSRVAGGFVGGIVAPGMKTAANALINQLETNLDPTSTIQPGT